jgi:hypothetical protein
MPVIHLPSPNISFEEAKRIAQDLYGITRVVRELPSEGDQNFLLRAGQPRRTKSQRAVETTPGVFETGRGSPARQAGSGAGGGLRQPGLGWVCFRVNLQRDGVAHTGTPFIVMSSGAVNINEQESPKATFPNRGEGNSKDLICKKLGMRQGQIIRLITKFKIQTLQFC